MTDLMLRYNWTYVSVINGEGPYQENGGKQVGSCWSVAVLSWVSWCLFFQSTIQNLRTLIDKRKTHHHGCRVQPASCWTLRGDFAASVRCAHVVRQICCSSLPISQEQVPK